jgi:hypothetical protein
MYEFVFRLAGRDDGSACQVRATLILKHANKGPEALARVFVAGVTADDPDVPIALMGGGSDLRRYVESRSILSNYLILTIAILGG